MATPHLVKIVFDSNRKDTLTMAIQAFTSAVPVCRRCGRTERLVPAGVEKLVECLEITKLWYQNQQ